MKGGNKRRGGGGGEYDRKKSWTLPEIKFMPGLKSS